MIFQTWLAFVVAAGIILIIPGPTILAVIGHSLVHGRRAVLPLVAGVTLGDLTALTSLFLAWGQFSPLSRTVHHAEAVGRTLPDISGCKALALRSDRCRGFTGSS